jgi:hypothetical protein
MSVASSRRRPIAPTAGDASVTSGAGFCDKWVLYSMFVGTEYKWEDPGAPGRLWSLVMDLEE